MTSIRSGGDVQLRVRERLGEQRGGRERVAGIPVPRQDQRGRRDRPELLERREVAVARAAQRHREQVGGDHRGVVVGVGDVGAGWPAAGPCASRRRTPRRPRGRPGPRARGTSPRRASRRRSAAARAPASSPAPARSPRSRARWPRPSRPRRSRTCRSPGGRRGRADPHPPCPTGTKPGRHHRPNGRGPARPSARSGGARRGVTSRSGRSTPARCSSRTRAPRGTRAPLPSSTTASSIASTGATGPARRRRCP